MVGPFVPVWFWRKKERQGLVVILHRGVPVALGTVCEEKVKVTRDVRARASVWEFPTEGEIISQNGGDGDRNMAYRISVINPGIFRETLVG